MITLLNSWSLYFREAKPSIKMAAGPVSERNQDATIYVGGLDEKVPPLFKNVLFRTRRQISHKIFNPALIR